MKNSTNIILIVLALIIVIGLLVYLYCVGINSSKPMKKDCTFIVTVDEQNQCYLVDGEPKKELILKRNRIYKFVINTPGHPFILTSSPIGGSLEGSIIKDTPEDVGLAEEGDFELIINNNTKSEFYYQSLKGERYGGKIRIR